MYPSYSDGIQHIETCMRAVEGDTGHVLLQSGVITLSLTANTPISQYVTIPRIFTPNTTPHIVVSLSSIGNVNSTIKNLVGSGASNTGFTIQALSDTTQSITVTWFAKGTTQ